MRLKGNPSGCPKELEVDFSPETVNHYRRWQRRLRQTRRPRVNKKG